MVLYAYVHMPMSVYQVPCSFPNRKPTFLYLPLLRAFLLRKDVHVFFCLPLSSSVILFFSSIPHLFDSVQPLFFVPEIDQATEVHVKDAAKNQTPVSSGLSGLEYNC